MKDCSSISATASPSWCRHDGVPTARDQGELCCPWRCSGGDYRWVIYMLASEVVWLLCSMWMYLSCPAHLNQCEDSSKIQPSLRLLLWIRRSWRSYFLVRWYNDTMNRIQLFVFFFRLTQSCSYSMISYLFSSTLNTTSSVESCSQWNARIFYPSITLSLIALQFEGHWAHSRFGKRCQFLTFRFAKRLRLLMSFTSAMIISYLPWCRVTKAETLNGEISMCKKHWTKIYERTHPPSFVGYRELDLSANPVILKPGQVKGIYIHSTRRGDEAIVYDNKEKTKTHDDSFITILPGRAHVSERVFGSVPIWGWWVCTWQTSDTLAPFESCYPCWTKCL
jgi:hypothetical protein